MFVSTFFLQFFLSISRSLCSLLATLCAHTFPALLINLYIYLLFQLPCRLSLILPRPRACPQPCFDTNLCHPLPRRPCLHLHTTILRFPPSSTGPPHSHPSKPAIPSCFMTLSHCLPSSGISWSPCDTSDHGLLQLTTSFDDRTLGLSPYLRASIYQPPYCQVTHYMILRACPWVCQSLCTYPWFAYHTLPRT